MRNPRIHFGLYNTSVSNVPREMFSNTQRVRNVTAEVRESDTRTLHNPSSGYEPGVPGQQFLMKLRLTGSYLTCDCAIGYDHCDELVLLARLSSRCARCNDSLHRRWIELWQRKHRQYREDRCAGYNEPTNFRREKGDEFICWDNGWDDDIRETFCVNKNNMSLSNALKTELECEWSGASHVLSSILPIGLSLLSMFVVIVVC